MTSRRVAARGAGLLGLGCALFSALLCGCEPRDQTPVGRGARVFQRSCSGCHGPDGRGVMRLGLVKPPRDLTNAEFHASISDDQLRSVIRTGKNQMPAFGGLMGDEDLNNVIAFIRTLPPGAKPAPGAAGQGPGAPAAPPAPGAQPSAPTVPTTGSAASAEAPSTAMAPPAAAPKAGVLP